MQQDHASHTREYSMGELADKIDESTRRLSEDIARVEASVESLKNRVAYSDMQEVKMGALEERLSLSVENANSIARQAASIAKWAIGVLIAILGTLIFVAMEATKRV
jgi:predicted DNA-binding protein YlxM (UPF0122 family)